MSKWKGAAEEVVVVVVGCTASTNRVNSSTQLSALFTDTLLPLYHCHSLNVLNSLMNGNASVKQNCQSLVLLSEYLKASLLPV